VLFPFALRSRRGRCSSWSAPRGVGGSALLLFGALNYFTHIGLIINTQ
jgi:hypothetical protein